MAILLLGCGLWFSQPDSAVALRTWTEGSAARPISAGDADGVVVADTRAGSGAQLARRVSWEYRGANEEFDPFSVEVLASGNLLVASRSNEVLEITRSRRIVWSYTRLKDDPRLENAYSAQRLANGNTLITDRRADFVIEVTPAKQVVWQYGAVKNSADPGSLVDPFFAQRLANGNTLITDNRGGNRVIEVRTGDYDPAAPNLGFTASSIVWRYGQDGVAGLEPGRLVSPRHAIRLPNGNTLISDAGDRDAEANRVIEVRPDGGIAWSFGTPGSAGADDTHLDRPSGALRLPNGNTLIIEEDGGRMLEVEPGGRIVDWYGAGVPAPSGGDVSKLRGVYRTEKGATVIADQGNKRLVEIGYPSKGTFVSEALSLGMPGVRKVISGLKIDADTPAGTSVAVEYSLDGGAWKALGTKTALPGGALAKAMRYRLTLRTENLAHTPVVKAVEIEFDVAPTGSKADATPASAGRGGSAGSATVGSSGSAGTSGSGPSGSGTSAGSSAASVSSGVAAGAVTGGGVPVDEPVTLAQGTARGTVLGRVGDEREGMGEPAPDALAHGASAGNAAALLVLGAVYGWGLAWPVVGRAWGSGLRFVRFRPMRG